MGFGRIKIMIKVVYDLNRMYNVLSNINLTQGTEYERSLIRFS